MNSQQERLLLETFLQVLDALKIIGFRDLQNTGKIGAVIDAMDRINDRLAQMKKNDTGEKQPIQYILAGTYGQYKEYLSENIIRHLDAKNMSLYHNWVSERPDKLILVGSWWEAEVWDHSNMRKKIIDLIVECGYNLD